MLRPAVLVAVFALAAWIPVEGARQPRPQPPPPPEPPGEPGTNPVSACGGLDATEVTGLLMNAVSAVDFPTLAVAVVDRPGNVIGLWLRGSPTTEQQDQAVGLARTGAFFSNDQAPLSSRTVRFVSGLHFPPGIARTGNAALYGIENTNRGCDLNVAFNTGKFLPRATSVAGGACNAFDTSGCGTGPVTGKVVDLSGTPKDTNPLAVNPGGLPIFRGRALVGGLGVAGAPASKLDAAEFAAFSAIVASGLSPVPSPLPAPGVVFIDGIRLPFVRQAQRPAGVSAGFANGVFTVAPGGGQCAPDGYLVGPLAGSKLSVSEVAQIVRQAVDAALHTRAVIRLPIGSRTHMVIAVGDVDGKILAIFRMTDSTVFSVDVAVAKARNVAWFSGPGAGDMPQVPPGTAISNRTISFGAQPLYPAGIDGSGPGPFFNLFRNDTLNPCSQGSEPPGPNQNGIVFFPGSLPLYKGSLLVGGLGVSGDGVEQDDYVTYLGAQGFLPPRTLQADNFFVNGVRLPFLKFPRNPEQ